MRIQEYMKKHRQAPPNLAVLPEWEGFNRTRDGWGHDIQYAVDKEGIVTLTSFGADGKPGGTGRDADIAQLGTRPRADVGKPARL